MRRVLMITLLFEVIIFLLAIPVMHYLSSVPLEQAALYGVGAAVLAVVSVGLLRSVTGYVLGWLTQAVGIALGFLTPPMFFVGALFAAIWVVTVILGRKLDAREA
jgi:chromate transport protein ChrA